ncbi:hypothetical protein C5N14_16630 [Micromonospora sp. MW-13]|uniref:hypothetical protein n=1 Tax=Micromonospora sp. MW-13 TaxID=2094022 RepID=UPI000E42F90A|nr:hypothetical protein [Micromonospora sp. MW-13]RGC67834.1 hypothetical protein C5N14_16630 [Micromonospora sp. MW-13]
MRRTLLPLLTIALVTGLACGAGDESPAESERVTGATSGPGSRATDADDAPADRRTAAPTNHSTAPARTKPLTCKQLETAWLGSAGQPYNGYHSPIRLTDGLWSGEDGVVVQLQWPCAVGELTGDDAADAVVPVLMDGGGTGKFWQLAVFRNANAGPAYLTMTEIGDRTPVEQVSISGRQVTVTFLMRPDDPSSPVDVIRRTAAYRLDGDQLVATGHTDAPV